jgi:hypothetical protein
LVPAFEKQAGNMPAHKPGRAGDECRFQFLVS